MPETKLTKDLINAGLRGPARKTMQVIFSGPDAPQKMMIEADPSVDWPMIIRNAVLAIEVQMSAAQNG